MKLNSDILLQITDYLKDTDKIKLINIVRGSSSQIKSYTVLSGPDFNLKEFQKVFQQLDNVRELIIDERNWGWNTNSEVQSTKKLILRNAARINQNISSFKIGQNNTPQIRDISIYIKEILRIDPNYDANNIIHSFDVNEVTTKLLNSLLKEYPQLKLKLKEQLPPFRGPCVQFLDEHINLITDITVKSTWQLVEQHPSVKTFTMIDIEGTWRSSEDCLRKHIPLMPSLQNVILFLKVNNVSIIFNQLLKVKNLQSLELKCHKYEWSHDDFVSLSNLMMKPSLKVIELNTQFENHQGIITELIQCTRTDFKSFEIRFNNHVTLSVKNLKMNIKRTLSIRLSLSDLLTKFKKIRIISVDIKSREDAENIQQQFQEILSYRPRNAYRIDLSFNEDKIVKPHPILRNDAEGQFY